MQQLQASQVVDWAKQMTADNPDLVPVVLDVREAWEVQTAAVPDAQAVHGYRLVHMPMRSVPARCTEFDRHQPVACLCHHGARSMQVAYFLEQNGFTQVANVQGGIHAWATDHDPRIPLY
jgi:rhodanese-related sulfurtransferase